MSQILVPLLLVLVVACERGADQAAPVQSTSSSKQVLPASSALPGTSSSAASSSTILKVTTLGHEGVIIPEALLKGTPSWTPTPAIVEKFEAGLVGYVQAQNPQASPAVDGFLRQYMGLYDGKQKVLQVDFFCRAIEGYGERPLAVFDFWGCHSSIEYLPDQGTYRHLVSKL